MMRDADEILNRRTLIANLPRVSAYRHDGRALVESADDLERIFTLYRKVYAKEPFVSIGIDLYWKEDKE